MHIHVPDGVFPAWIWISSIIMIVPLLSLAVYMVRNQQKKLVITSAVTALMLIVFSIEIFGFHLNFTALTGILLGPWWSLISITIVNIFLALFGHGGVTVSPINILINWFEAIIGFILYRYVVAHFKSQTIKAGASGIVVINALVLSFILFLGVISLTGINPGLQIEENTKYIPLLQFVWISIIPTAIGAVLEALLTSLVIGYILKTKPRLLN